MRLVKEDARFKNLNTLETTVVDAEGNTAEIGGEGSEFEDFDFGLDGGGGNEDGMRPDGTHDELDEFFGALQDEFGLDDELGGEADPEGLGMEGDLPPEEALGGEEESEFGLDDEEGLGGEEAEQDPDYQGVIRTVTGANLVYKRKVEDGAYEELWVYNIGGNMKAETKIRRAILAGTDIGAQAVSSEDGTQESETTSVGNVQFLKITGLPN